MENRLKLYDALIKTYISNKEKKKFRKIAFQNKKTVSDFNRMLIQLVIKLDEMKNQKSNFELTSKDINTLLNSIWGDD